MGHLTYSTFIGMHVALHERIVMNASKSHPKVIWSC